MPIYLLPSVNNFIYILIIVLPLISILSVLFDGHRSNNKTIKNFIRLLLVIPLFILMAAEFAVSQNGFFFIKQKIITNKEIQNKLFYNDQISPFSDQKKYVFNLYINTDKAVSIITNNRPGTPDWEKEILANKNLINQNINKKNFIISLK